MVKIKELSSLTRRTDSEDLSLAVQEAAEVASRSGTLLAYPLLDTIVYIVRTCFIWELVPGLIGRTTVSY